MKIKIVTVGKKHDQKLAAAIEDYTKRLSAKQVSWTIVPSSHAPTPLQQRQAESTTIRSHLKPSDYVVLLDEAGEQLTNEALTHFLQDRQNQSTKVLVFIIGGAYGVSKDIKDTADITWSLSKLTFPHQLARLILIEQLYRAYSSLDGSGYHHGS